MLNQAAILFFFFSFLLKIKRYGKRENLTKLTAITFEAYRYLSLGDQDSLYTTPIRHKPSA